MKKRMVLKLATMMGVVLSVSSLAQASLTYELTITNGTKMPLSPAVIYTRGGGDAAASVGTESMAGFVQLCQTGNHSTRIQEIKADKKVTFATNTTGLLMPGESKTIEVEVHDPANQSIHFETMYGKSKDVCGVGSVNSHSLVALKQHVTATVTGKDNALLTGAFTEPALPAGMTYLESSICAQADDAVSCLRELSQPVSGKAHIRFFSGYLPSLVGALETKYGTNDLQTLLFPVSGGIHFNLKLKH